MVQESEVLKAIEEIVSEKGRLTRETVTERLGGGSPNVIAPILRKYKEGRRKRMLQEVKELVAAYRRLPPVDQKIFRDEVRKLDRKQSQ